jgi:hypothetical protein
MARGSFSSKRQNAALGRGSGSRVLLVDGRGNGLPSREPRYRSDLFVSIKDREQTSLGCGDVRRRLGTSPRSDAREASSCSRTCRVERRRCWCGEGRARSSPAQKGEESHEGRGRRRGGRTASDPVVRCRLVGDARSDADAPSAAAHPDFGNAPVARISRQDAVLRLPHQVSSTSPFFF